MPKAIQDWLKDEPISRQRKWQLRKQEKGLCTICGESAINATHCQHHAVLKSKRCRKYYYAHRTPASQHMKRLRPNFVPCAPGQKFHQFYLDSGLCAFCTMPRWLVEKQRAEITKVMNVNRIRTMKQDASDLLAKQDNPPWVADACRDMVALCNRILGMAEHPTETASVIPTSSPPNPQPSVKENGK